MSIASEITRINNNIAAAYTAANGKGATLPVTQNSANLATCIGSIQTGSTPTLVTKNITQNGTYNASSDNADGYSSVTVNVTAGQTRVVENGVYTKPTNNFTFVMPSNATDIGDNALSDMFIYQYGVVSADLSSLTTISGQGALSNAFVGCSSLISVDLSSLTTISGYEALSSAFTECSGLINFDFPSLVTISGDNSLWNAFAGCTYLTSVDFPNLTTISGAYAFGQAFSTCYGLTSIIFPSLTTINNVASFVFAFAGCSNLTSLSFPALTSTSFGLYTNQFEMMLADVSGCTVHFPSNLQSVIGSWNDVINGFGGTNTTVLFDLPATE